MFASGSPIPITTILRQSFLGRQQASDVQQLLDDLAGGEVA